MVLPSTELNDVRFHLRCDAGTAFITDSGGPNAIIVVDLATRRARRRLNGHPRVTAESGFLPIVEGQPLMIRKPGQPPMHRRDRLPRARRPVPHPGAVPVILSPDTLTIGPDRHLYFTVNQLHRRAQYHNGHDLRVKPYALLRTPIDAGPVRLG